MADNGSDKSQEATPHRRQLAREQGQVAKSQDLTSAALLLVGLGGLAFLGGSMASFFAALTRHQLGGEAWLTADADFAVAVFNALLVELAGLLLPLLGILVLAAVGLHLMQGGWLFLPDKLVPDLARLDPIKGLGRIFSLAGAVRLGFGVFKLLVVTAIACFSLWGEWDQVLALPAASVAQVGLFLVDVLFWTSVKVAGALFLLALLDYGFQWWKQEQDLRMTQQEVREELKDLQGDPQVIARRRSVQRQLILNRLGSAVPKGDVTVTNPTELAVTLQYDPETMKAPIVVAKGAGLVAQRIRQLSLQHGVPIVEKKPLAQALYKEVDVGRPVPHQLYAAVAEVLHYVYQLKGKKLPGA